MRRTPPPSPGGRHVWRPYNKGRGDATPEQRADYELYGSSVYFKQLDDGFSNETSSFGNPHLFKELGADRDAMLTALEDELAELDSEEE